MRLTFLAIFFILAITANVAAVTLDDIQTDVMCTCGCGKVLENCDCGTAERMREEIKGMISKGMTKERIIKKLQNMYGKEVLVNPPKEGVFLGLWYYPAIAVGAGIAVIYVLLRKRDVKWYADPDEIINEENSELEH